MTRRDTKNTKERVKWCLNVECVDPLSKQYCLNDAYLSSRESLYLPPKESEACELIFFDSWLSLKILMPSVKQSSSAHCVARISIKLRKFHL